MATNTTVIRDLQRLIHDISKAETNGIIGIDGYSAADSALEAVTQYLATLPPDAEYRELTVEDITIHARRG
jgi:hypothetical protein